MADAVLFLILEDSSGEHFEACDATRVAPAGKFKVLRVFVSWVFSDDGFCF